MGSVDRINGLTGDLAIKTPVRVATTANITLSGLQTIDDILLVDGDRVLVKNQTNAVDNGIWKATTSSWSRALDWDGSYDVVQGTLVKVIAGTVNPGVFQLDTASPVIGTSEMAFSVSHDLTLVADLASTASGKGGWLIGFIQAGIGAVARWVMDKLRDTVSMYDYGVVANDVNDDTAAFQAAVDAVYAAGGGKLSDRSLRGTLRLSATINLRQGVEVDISQTAISWAGTDSVIFNADFTGNAQPLWFSIYQCFLTESSAATVKFLSLTQVSGGDLKLWLRGGGYGVYSTASYNYRILNYKHRNAAQAAIYHQGDGGAEMYIDTAYISFGQSFVGKYGIELERTTSTDVGGYYFDKVLIAKGPAGQSTLDAGIYVHSSAAAITTMAIQMAGGGVDGAFDHTLGKFSMKLENIATAYFTGAWFDKIGMYKTEATLFGNCNAASGFYFKDAHNSANFIASNISCGETTPFNFDASATVTNFYHNNVRAFPGFELANDLAKMTAGYSHTTNKVYTSRTVQNGSYRIADAGNPANVMHLRINSTGNLMFLDSAFAEIFEIRQSGSLSSLGSNAVHVIGGNQVVSARKTGWGAPTGTVSRSALNSDTTTTASAGYVQAEAQSVADRLLETRRALNALITDLRSHGLIGN